MKTKLSTFILFFTLSCVSFAQVKLSGTVVNPSQQPLDFAEILLLDQNEKLLQHTYTDETGQFSFENIPSDSYTLRVNNLGITQYETSITLTQDVTLAPLTVQNDKMLDEIVVATQAKVFERKVDRTVFNIEQSVHANNSNAKDLLKLTPGLKVDKDQIALIGKSSMQVMINDKMLPLTGEELMNYLQTIPSETIQKIEIISTPPAKYEASGNSGLINIVLKQAKHNSWNNQISTGFEATDKALWKISDVFNYSKNKLSLAGAMNASRGYNQEIGKMNLHYPTETWNTVYRETKQNKDLSGSFQLDYQATPKTGFGVQYRGSKNTQQTTDNNQVDVNNSVDNLIKNINTKGKSSPDFNNHAINLNLTHKFDTVGNKLNLDLDYFNYKINKSRVFNTNTHYVDNFVNNDQQAQTEGDQKIDNYSAKIDLEHPFSFANLSYGAKVSVVKTVNNANSSTFNGQTTLPEIIQADHFIYRENIQAAYVSASKSFGKKWEAQVGLRVESTQTTGESIATQTTEKTNYTELFPTLYVSYKINEENNLSMSANRRISRPSFWQLNPFRWYVNEYNYVTGDPALKPTYVNAMNVNYTFKNKLFINASYSKVTDLASQYSNIDTENHIQVLKQGNIFDAASTNLSITHVFDTWHWLNSQNTLSAFYNSSKLIQDVQVDTHDGMGYYFSSNNTLQLNADKTFQAQVDFWYQSKLNNGNWKLKPMYGLNLGLKYAMLDKKLNISAYMNDILRTSHLRAQATSDGVKQQYNMYHDNRYFTLGLSYSFGNSKIQVKERQGSNKDIINRK
ncbi:outer membrane beta-barrel family protein [Myroides fluvii]|uniref:outer membrane beta-barrel family protein n=1 Tax=Myroides fluvii TaxID=2572594 RepID=UPI00131A649E|nr:outer membrane beta-barrel family protein [Myroides fluvii]